MADREINVTMDSTYRSGLTKELRKDQRRLDAFQKILKRRPLEIPIKLDISGAKAQMADFHKTILGELAKVSKPGIVGADGRPASAGQQNHKAGLLSSTRKESKKKNEWVLDEIVNTRQLAKGLVEISRHKDDISDAFATVTKDTTNIEDLRESLRGMGKDRRDAYAKAKGLGDKDGQLVNLRAQRDEIDAALKQAAAKGQTGSQDYLRGEKQLGGLYEKIATLEGRQESDGEKQSRKDKTREVSNAINDEQRRVQKLLKANKLEMDGTALIADKATRLAEVNRLYDARRKIFDDSKGVFGKMDADLQGKGRFDQADRAMRGQLGMQNQRNQVDLDQSRGETDRKLAEVREQARIDKENQRKAERATLLADQAAKRSGNRNFNRALRLDQSAVNMALRQNDVEIAQAKAMPNRVAMEGELNRLLAERVKIHGDSFSRLGGLQQRQGLAGNADNAAKAEAAKLRAQDAAGKVVVSQTKADADAVIAARRDAEAAQKKQDAADHASRESAFKREMQDIKARSDKRIAEINEAERKAKQAHAGKGGADARAAASATGHSLRQTEFQNRAAAFDDLEGRARSAGHTTTADTARGKRLGAEVSGAKDMERFSTATVKSGHALDFHSSNLIRNGISFVKWQIPMQVVMRSMQAFSAGVAGAIKVDRQFATLQAVFRGTADDAQRLKNETLDLAVAQGRSADEAMDSSIRWSRLGLSRVQVLEATRVSLMAANVAEITSAESAEKLSGIYATYRLNVGDLAGVLNRLNSISNNYNVTVDDLFQGISRVSGVAKQSGLALRDLEGIIGSVVGAGGGSGSEVGNALKFVITRLGDADVGAKLKKSFDIDLTGPNGDFKDMSQILREMAALYPTLNKSEQQYFLQLASGSRQASRFSKVMTEFRQGQILAAKAGFDHAASLRENDKILASLQSRIDSLATSWTSLFTAMGDAGVFEFVIKQMRGIQAAIDGIHSSRRSPGEVKKNEVNISDPYLSETVDEISGSDDLGNSPIQSRTDVLKTILSLDKAIKGRKKLIAETGDDAQTAYKKHPIRSFAEGLNYGGTVSEQRLPVASGVVANVAEAEQIMKRLLAIVDEGGNGSTVASDEVAAIINSVMRLRDELEALPRSAGVFESLGAEFAAGNVARDSLIRQFGSISFLLTTLDDGQRVYNDSLVEFNKILAAGDKGKMQEFLNGLGKSFTSKIGSVGAAISALAAKGTPVLANELAGLEEKRRKISAAPIGDSDGSARQKETDLAALDSAIKNVTSRIETLNAAAEKVDLSFKNAFNPAQTANISKYLDDVLAQAKEFGDTFKDLTPDIDGDPVARIFERRRSAMTTGLDWLKEIQGDTGTEADNRIGAASNALMVATANGDPKEIAAQQKIIDQQQEAKQIAATRVLDEEERLEKLLRELDIQERVAQLARIQTDASKFADNSSQAWRFGETDSDKDSNQAAMAIQRANENLRKAKEKSGRAPADKASDTGMVLQDEATARADLMSMTVRQYSLDAARKQVAIDTTKAMREQTEEASKRLAMASREDQLRAAALTRTLRDKGPVKDREFFALSQESRQAFTSFRPNDAPGFLNEAKEAARKSYREIDAEQGRITSVIGKLRGKLDKLADDIGRETGGGRALNPRPKAPDGSIQDAATREKQPLVKIALGDVAVNIALHKEVEGMMKGFVLTAINNGLAALEQRLTRPPTPSHYGVLE